MTRFHSFKTARLLLWAAALLGVGTYAMAQSKPKAAATPMKLLVFSKTKGFRHSSIPVGKAAIMKMGSEKGFAVDTTEDASKFTEQNLRQYRAVVFLSTTGDVLNNAQQADFERYIQSGGGFVGIHAATDTAPRQPQRAEGHDARAGQKPPVHRRAARPV